MAKSTLRDVARRAGVSVTTVSNVVRGWPYISDATRARVQRAIAELNYSPDPIAQGLRTGRTQVIGFIVPDIANPHFAAMVSIVEDVAHEQGYSVLVFSTHEDSAREADCIRRVAHGWGDGLLIVQAAPTNQLDPRALPVPVVGIDRVPGDFAGAGCTVDNSAVAELAVRHLAELGHRRIAHLSGPPRALPAQARAAGYRRWMGALGLDYRYASSNPGVWSAQEGYRATGALLDEGERPTALFASNDRLAIGAAHALRERGLRVPEDVSLVGVDDIETSRYLNPPLTSVRQPLEAMARAGIDLLLRLIEGKQTPAEASITLAPTLVVRASTAPPEL